MSEENQTNRPIWEAESENSELCDKLRQNLRDVRDPELGMDVIQLGLIRNVVRQLDQTIIEMILTTPFCPYAPAMVEMVKKSAEKTLKMDVSVALSMDPWDYSMMEDGGEDAWSFFR